MSEHDAPPPSLIPPADPIRSPSVTIPEFPSAPFGLFEAPSRAALTRSLMPPMPEVAPILDQATKAREASDWDGALDAYKKALFVIPDDARSTQASIYASIAEVKISQGKPREAETNFEKALAILPKHPRSLEGLIAIATYEKDWARVAVARRRRADALDDQDERASELHLVAEIEDAQLRDPSKALATLESALPLRPDDVDILLKLRELYADKRAWPQLVGTLDQLVRVSTDPKQRGSFRFAQADVVLGRLREEPRGLAFLELALDEDPRCDRALSALVAVRTRREEWAELAAVYEQLIDRHAGAGDRDRAWEVCRRLGTLRRDRLHDGKGALEAFTGALEVRPDDVESRAAVAELHSAKGDRDTAIRELEIVAAHAPLRAQTYRRLFDLQQRAQRPDRAWLVATCLEELGASDVAHDVVIDQGRPDGPIRPRAAVAEAWWGEHLEAAGADPIVDAILLAVGDAAIALRLEELAATRKLVVLDPATKQDKSSTASAVRTFVWASRALGIAPPDLYVRDDVPSGIAAVPAAAPSTALGPSALQGKSVQQLAFLAGRHLTYYRPAHYPLVFFPTLSELSALVLGAMRLVIPGLSVPPPAEGSRAIDGLGARLGPEERAKLEAAVARLEARGGKLDLFAWIRAVELTATRTGLLLAGDLRTVMRLLKEEGRAIAELGHDAKRGDLLAYVASERYAELRRRMGLGGETR